ncbi:docking protein 1b [Kryptolebias marmoratus]|uniref:Docking protein 1b n=1 Tax=Kryptolebias marmoratus TaxID=37003 RepID=A0A3Q2ZXZ6_KRYMA|nr:docking protein 1b [Kryptolebias marmoratus]
MDAFVKEGQLYVQHQKFGKKWKKNWFVLYPASQNGIARLEFFDSPSGGSGTSAGSGGSSNEKTRKLDKKIIRLLECISILPALTETCPKDNMAAFCVETNDKTHVFAAEKNTAKEWMDTMCDIAFQGGNGSSAAVDCNGRPQDLQMSENLIYYSREEVNEFWVTVQRTDASERCGLAGNYWLKAESDVLILKEPKTKRKVLVWPYKLLRRYGRDRVMFSFEAGRRCDSGPGNFTFETKQGNEIFTLVDQAIQLQKDLVEDRHLSGPQSLDLDCPLSLQHVRNAVPSGVTSGSGDSSSCSSREADGDSGGSKPGSADGVLGKREAGDGGGGGGGGKGQGGGTGLKGRSLPEPPGMLGVLGGGGTSPRTLRGKVMSSPDEIVNLYSEPVDSVRVPVHSSDCLYSDPVDSIKVQNPTLNPCTPPVPTPRNRPTADDVSGGGLQGDHHPGVSNAKKIPDLYSHVYDQIGQDLNQKTSALNLNGGVGGGRGAGRGVNNKRPPGGKAEGSSSPPGPSVDHIYDEPEGCAKGSTVPGLSGITVYDEARLEPPVQRRQEEVGGPPVLEGTYSNPSKGKPSDPQRQSPKQPGPSRGTPQLPAPRPKPATAPKPNKGPFARKEPVPPPPGKHGSNVNNNNNNSVWSAGGGGKEVYSKVSKQKPPPARLWLKQNHTAPLRSPDIIYDNLGDI